MPAKYFVTIESMTVPGVGLVKHGGVFDAPAEYVPSVTLRAVNESARVELDRAFAARDALLNERLEYLTGADRYAIRREIEELRARRVKAQVLVSEVEADTLRASRTGTYAI